MAKNKKNKPQQKEIKKSDIADAAFKKKVTIINGCILLNLSRNQALTSD